MRVNLPDRPVELASDARLDAGQMGDIYALPGGTDVLKVYRGYGLQPEVVADALRRSADAGRVLASLAGPLRFAAAREVVLVETEEDQLPGLVMPRATGEPLGAWMIPARDQAVKVNVLHRILQGIAQMHDSGIAHNDLSLGNLLIGREIWLIDFDRAGQAPPPLTRDSVCYRSDGWGVAADLRAFAILVQLVVEGSHPFSDDLPGLIAGHARHADARRCPTDPAWARCLDPALAGDDTGTAAQMLADWPRAPDH